MRKWLGLILTLVMLVSVASTALAEGYKIAILTGTVSQGEEEFRAAENAKLADPDGIIVDTYPDAFVAEQETTISKMQAFASDPDVKAIVMVQGVPGAVAGFTKVREMGRDDILLIAGVPQEVPALISAAADVVLYADEAAQGDSIMETVANWGVDVFIHYSFPRHMAMEAIILRHERLKENAEALGIEFVDVTALDPLAEGGMPAAQQFVLEDVPAQMEKYAGKKVAFFSTNCGTQEALQPAVLAQPNAYYPQPCCPSPYHKFFGTLSIPQVELGNDEAALKAIAEALVEHDAVGRFSTWPAPINMALVDIGVAYARAFIEGKTEGRNDTEALLAIMDENLPGAKVGNFTDADGVSYDNFYTVLLAPVDFNEYCTP
ncbi:MAG TPA: DUF3798 domain-containing protein [Candidatus Limnocylindria bacterium]|nr:DUF3798 domain-containing protein [Candidatus Limnocylindria bacterium]